MPLSLALVERGKAASKLLLPTQLLSCLFLLRLPRRFSPFRWRCYLRRKTGAWQIMLTYDHCYFLMIYTLKPHGCCYIRFLPSPYPTSPPAPPPFCPFMYCTLSRTVTYIMNLGERARIEYNT